MAGLLASQAASLADVDVKIGQVDFINNLFASNAAKISAYNQAEVGYIITGPGQDGNQGLDRARLSFLQALVEPLGAEVRQLVIDLDLNFVANKITMPSRAPAQTELLATPHIPALGLPVNLSSRYNELKLKSPELHDIFIFEKKMRDARREGINGFISTVIPVHIKNRIKELNFERGIKLEDLSMETFSDQEMYDALRHSSLSMTSIQAKALVRQIPALDPSQPDDFKKHATCWIIDVSIHKDPCLIDIKKQIAKTVFGKDTARVYNDMKNNQISSIDFLDICMTLFGTDRRQTSAAIGLAGPDAANGSTISALRERGSGRGRYDRRSHSANSNRSVNSVNSANSANSGQGNRVTFEGRENRGRQPLSQQLTSSLKSDRAQATSKRERSRSPGRGRPTQSQGRSHRFTQQSRSRSRDSNGSNRSQSQEQHKIARYGPPGNASSYNANANANHNGYANANASANHNRYANANANTNAHRNSNGSGSDNRSSNGSGNGKSNGNGKGNSNSNGSGNGNHNANRRGNSSGNSNSNSNGNGQRSSNSGNQGNNGNRRLNVNAMALEDNEGSDDQGTLDAGNTTPFYEVLTEYSLNMIRVLDADADKEAEANADEAPEPNDPPPPLIHHQLDHRRGREQQREDEREARRVRFNPPSRRRQGPTAEWLDQAQQAMEQGIPAPDPWPAHDSASSDSDRESVENPSFAIRQEDRHAYYFPVPRRLTASQQLNREIRETHADMRSYREEIEIPMYNRFLDATKGIAGNGEIEYARQRHQRSLRNVQTMRERLRSYMQDRDTFEELLAQQERRRFDNS